MPPSSPKKTRVFDVEAVGIPTRKKVRIIANTGESKYEQGYDSDGSSAAIATRSR